MEGSTVATTYWHPLGDGRVQCDVCPRACKLRDGQKGLCFVRAREGDGIVLTTYGRSSGFCVDPVEKKPLNHFLPGSSILSFGTAGCNLACRFCQNWDISKSKEIDSVAVRDLPHAAEHSLEVQLPFLQTVLDSFQVLPLAVGHGRPEEVADVLDVLWGGPETVVVVSTDLSHHYRYDVARDLDRRTAAAIVAADADAIGNTDACGSHALRGVLAAARRRDLPVEQIDLRSSGDTAGDRGRVVGYGAFAIG